MNGSPWIASLCGPLILIPESTCEQWAGAPRDWSEDEGDYGRACAVGGFIGLIDTDLNPLLDRVLPSICWDEQLTWDVPGPVVLFDSVYSYSQVIDEGEERLRIEFPAGRHTVRAGHIHIPHEAWLILIQITGPDVA